MLPDTLPHVPLKSEKKKTATVIFNKWPTEQVGSPTEANTDGLHVNMRILILILDDIY